MPFAGELATVAIEGSDSGQCGSLIVGQGAEFGHESDQGSGGEHADALHLLQAIDFGADLRGFFDQSGHENLQGADLLLQKGDGGGDDAELLFVGEKLGEILVLRDLGEEMGAVLDQPAEPLLEGIGEGKWRWLESAAKFGDDAGIDAVSLGQTVAGTSEVTNLTGVDLDDGATSRMGQSDEQSLASSAGFADGDRLGWKGFEPLADRFLFVGQAGGMRAVEEIEVGFGNIDTDIDFHRMVWSGAVHFFYLRIRTLVVQATVQVLSMRRGRIGLTRELGRFQSKTIFSPGDFFARRLRSRRAKTAAPDHSLANG